MTAVAQKTVLTGCLAPIDKDGLEQLSKKKGFLEKHPQEEYPAAREYVLGVAAQIGVSFHRTACHHQESTHD